MPDKFMSDLWSVYLLLLNLLIDINYFDCIDRGEGGNKIELIDTAKAIALSSDEVAMLATKLAKEITDRRMRNVSPSRQPKKLLHIWN